MKNQFKRSIIIGSLFVFMLTGCTSADAKKYENAKELMDGGSYTEAAEIFSSIKEYEDSEELYASCMYSQGQAYMDDNNYTGAKECFEEIPDYEDVSKLIDECDHMIAVKNDETAPTISGIAEGDVIELKFNEEFNLKKYLDGAIKIKDDVSENIDDYTIRTTAEIYDPDNGEVNTLQDGTYEFAVNAEDEAKNKSTVNFSIHIDATLYVSKDSEFPIVVYEDELGKYTINSVTHYSSFESAPNYIEGYYFEIEMENSADVDTVAYFGRVYLNDYRIPCYTDMSQPIAPGKKGVINSSLYDSDIDDKTKDFDKIECDFIIGDGKENELFVRPVVIDRDVIENK